MRWKWSMRNWYKFIFKRFGSLLYKLKINSSITSTGTLQTWSICNQNSKSVFEISLKLISWNIWFLVDIFISYKSFFYIFRFSQNVLSFKQFCILLNSLIFQNCVYYNLTINRILLIECQLLHSIWLIENLLQYENIAL